MAKEVDSREKELTHQVHREWLQRASEQVKQLTPALISGIKIFITTKTQGQSCLNFSFITTCAYTLLILMSSMSGWCYAFTILTVSLTFSKSFPKSFQKSVSLQQRMDSPASCATSCTIPTADESSHSATTVLHLYTAMPRVSYTLHCASCLIPPLPKKSNLLLP